MPPLIARGAAMCAEDAVVFAELVTGDLPIAQALPAFMARRMPRVEIVVRNSMQLVRYKMGTEPRTDADMAHAISSTLDFLAAWLSRRLREITALNGLSSPPGDWLLGVAEAVAFGS